MEDNKFIIYDENGFEKEMQILFTFEIDENNKYVIYHNIDDDSEYFAGKYNDEGELFTDISEEELEICLEMLNTFIDEIEVSEDDE